MDGELVNYQTKTNLLMKIIKLIIKFLKKPINKKKKNKI
jgi:hypothetical protein